MSISSALNSAVTGLTATSRAADVISSNLANVLTPGYSTRDIALQARVEGGSGVGVVGITRQTDPGLLADKRQADGELAFADTRAKFLQTIERSIGTPDQPSSLSARLASFEAGLVAASSNPENPAMLQGAINSAVDLTTGLNQVSADLQKQRTEADAAIKSAVTQVNDLLGQIRDVNSQLGSYSKQDHYAATLMDQRQALVDEVSTYIPVNQIPRGNNTIALFTSGGAILLDGSPAELDFTQSNVVAPHMTIENGLLSGLTINGVDVRTSGDRNPIAGGKLSALFSVRDELSTGVQAQLDAVSRDLIERFQQAGLDTTRAPGAAGLLTDDNAFFTPSNEIGLAGRISVNTVVDPAQGGEAWRLRDGLGASAPGSPGNGALITQLADTLQESRGATGGALGSVERSASGHMADLISGLAETRLSADREMTFATARQTSLADLQLQLGVDSDAELQKLLLVEQAYAANARLIQTVDEMMQSLLRI